MGHAHPEAGKNIALVEFHKRGPAGHVEPLGVNAFLVMAFEECHNVGCGGTQLHLLTGLSICVLEDIDTTRLKLQRERRPFYEQLAEKMRKNESN